ncbi:MAG: hypothetical protein A2Y89_06425 [Chloroflexi bacterium RBG_13_51_18]|nr:MAG: hypothetical protein A2Y89_06425 [Chloroflexi bacterium RBG_13_51_18]
MQLQVFYVLCLLIIALSILPGCGDTTGPGIDTPAPNLEQQLVNIGVLEAYDLIQANNDNPDFIIIDVRTPEEYAAGHIENAVMVDYNSAGFREEISKFDKDKKYLIYCLTGWRSARARDITEELGFRYVYNMEGGFTEWIAENLPVVI